MHLRREWTEFVVPLLSLEVNPHQAEGHQPEIVVELVALVIDFARSLLFEQPSHRGLCLRVPRRDLARLQFFELMPHLLQEFQARLFIIVVVEKVRFHESPPLPPTPRS